MTGARTRSFADHPGILRELRYTALPSSLTSRALRFEPATSIPGSRSQSGSVVEFRNADLEPSEALSVTTNYDGLSADVKVGDVMLVDNGEIHFQVTATASRAASSVRGPHRGIHGIAPPHQSSRGESESTRPDRTRTWLDIKVAAELDVDFVAISFVRDAEHVRHLRYYLAGGRRFRRENRVQDRGPGSRAKSRVKSSPNPMP